MGDDARADEIVCRLDDVLRETGVTLAELGRRTGVSTVNLSILKNNRARAVRFSTLAAICDALGVQPGDLFTWRQPHRG